MKVVISKTEELAFDPVVGMGIAFTLAKVLLRLRAQLKQIKERKAAAKTAEERDNLQKQVESLQKKIKDKAKQHKQAVEKEKAKKGKK
jgi:Co/Zn/Cd efflux system component